MDQQIDPLGQVRGDFLHDVAFHRAPQCAAAPRGAAGRRRGSRPFPGSRPRCRRPAIQELNRHAAVVRLIRRLAKQGRGLGVHVGIRHVRRTHGRHGDVPNEQNQQFGMPWPWLRRSRIATASDCRESRPGCGVSLRPRPRGVGRGARAANGRRPARSPSRPAAGTTGSARGPASTARTCPGCAPPSARQARRHDAHGEDQGERLLPGDRQPDDDHQARQQQHAGPLPVLK